MKVSQTLTVLSILLVSASFSIADFDFSNWNNAACNKQCWGDLNCDGVILLDDVMQLALYIDSIGGAASYPDPSYRPQFDLDRNFILDAKDIERSLLVHTIMPDCGKKLKLLPLSNTGFQAGTEVVLEWQWHVYTDNPPAQAAEDRLGDIGLYYSLNNGTDWVLIDTLSEVFSYAWQLPEATSQDCLLKIVDLNHAGLEDLTGLFTIWQCQKTLHGDLNNDCYINLTDLALLASEWMDCGHPYDPDCAIH